MLQKEVQEQGDLTIMVTTSRRVYVENSMKAIDREVHRINDHTRR